MSLGAMDIFKFLPAGKKETNANCKKCGCATCMMFALKLSKSQVESSLCPYIPSELSDKLEHNKKVQQETVLLGNLKIGGETVLYRHEKTFVNPCALCVCLDSEDKEFESKLKRILDFEFESIGKKYRVDAIYLKNPTDESVQKIKSSGIEVLNDDFLSKLKEVEFKGLAQTVDELVKIRTKAIVDRDENYSKPVFVRLFGDDFCSLCSIASSLICKYSNMIIFEYFDEALFASLITLRVNIYTDPQKPLQVESKVYEFNNPDENALVFMTTNFALSYFAVANELSSLKCGSYLVITPSEGMSVLTAFSAEKFTSKMVAKTLKKFDLANKVKTRKIIIPGLLAPMKNELEKALPEFEIIVGTIEAYSIGEFVKKLT